jgi:hypothetical protein
MDKIYFNIAHQIVVLIFCKEVTFPIQILQYRIKIPRFSFLTSNDIS